MATCKTRGRPVQTTTLRQLERDVKSTAKKLSKKVTKLERLKAKYNECGNRTIKLDRKVTNIVSNLPPSYKDD